MSTTTTTTATGEATTTPVVALDGVTRRFRKGGHDVVAVDDVSLEVTPGQLVALHGRSGSGKTTLLNLIGGLDDPTSGHVAIEGRELAGLGEKDRVALRRDRIAFIFQAFGLLPVLSASENVEIPLRLVGADPGVRDARVAALLRLVGLGDRMHHRPHELSGGEQQRVAIARALANQPALLLADEPTGQLDSRTGASIMRLLVALVEGQGMSAIVTTHDPSLLELAHRAVELRDGRVVHDTDVDGPRSGRAAGASPTAMTPATATAGTGTGPAEGGAPVDGAAGATPSTTAAPNADTGSAEASPQDSPEDPPADHSPFMPR